MFYDKGSDIILNPLDDRSPYWSIFNEAENPIDFDTIASALIPEDAATVDPYWKTAARTLFSSVAGELLKVSCKIAYDNYEIYDGNNTLIQSTANV